MLAIICYVAGILSGVSCLFIAGGASKRSPVLEPLSENGTYVEVDCRGCLKLNRVPAARLRDRPLCGRCRDPLAPSRRLVICKVSSMDAALSSELDRVWSSPVHLWDKVADHLSVPKKASN